MASGRERREGETPSEISGLTRRSRQPVHYLWANRHENAAQIINRIKYNYEICSLFAVEGEGHVSQAGECGCGGELPLNAAH